VTVGGTGSDVTVSVVTDGEVGGSGNLVPDGGQYSWDNGAHDDRGRRWADVGGGQMAVH
jgi:hypothetical protein